MSLAPVIKHTFFTNAGAPAIGYRLFSYVAGTTTKLATYSNAALTVANTNPIILDSAGRASIFLSADSYKFVLAPDTPADDPPTVPIWTMDNISAVAELTTNQDIVAVAGENIAAGNSVYISDGSGGKTSGRWYKADADDTYSSSAALLVGMAPYAITSGATGVVRISGRITGLSSLTAGATYYISATAGAITATAPSNLRTIGVADTTTSLIISAVGSVSAGSGGSSAVGDGTNLCADAGMLIWAAGDTAAPSHYSLGGVTAAVQRCGTGLADTVTKYGPYCARLTGAAGGAGTLDMALLDSGSFESYWQSKTFAFGAWVKGAAGSVARLYIGDGAGDSWSSYNSGTGWEWLTVSRTLDGSASVLYVGFEVQASSVAYVSGFTAVAGSNVPTKVIPSQTVYGTLVVKRSGTLAIAANFDAFMPSRPLLVKDVCLRAVTGPVGDDLIVDVLHWDGATSKSMFSTLPQVNDGANYGQAQPDGTYRYRCFTQGHAAGYTDGLLSVSITQVGSTTPGDDLTVFIRCLQYNRPLESFLVYNE
jgi:hypothetical protein